jgi:phosphoadenosine phosphosulfate reductase
VRLYWCEDLNVPVLDPGDAVDKCSRFVETRLAEPADPRPAFPADIEIAREAVINEFGDSQLAGLLIPADEVVVLNKIPGYADQADEIVVRGRIVGHRFYDVIERRWRFRPLYEAVSLMLAERRGFWAVVDMAELPAGYDVHPDRIIEGSLPGVKFRHVAVSSRDGRFHGVAKLFRGRRLHIVKSWRARGPLPPGRPSSIKDAAELNRGRVMRLTEKAVRLVRSVTEEYRLPVVVSYSGGKDSLVALDIVAKSGVKLCVYFNDTGLEPRETYENLRAVSEHYGVEIIVGSAGDRFWRAARLFGPPARDYRWCCKVIKLGPTTKVLGDRFPGGFVSVVGQRGAESFQRSRLPPVSRSRWVAGAIVVAPLQEWTALDVWFYIFLHGLPYNPAYERGFDRLGCVICPANELAELELVRRHYPEVYKKLNAILKEHFSDKEIELGLWRWRGSVPGDMARWAGARAAGRRLPVRIARDGARVEVELDAEPDAETFTELLKILSKARGARGERTGGRAVRIERTGNIWKITASDAETALNAAGLLVRSAICGKCDLCIYWCPARALERAGTGLKVDEVRCTGCLLCNEVCPSVQYLVRRSAALTAGPECRPAGSRGRGEGGRA